MTSDPLGNRPPAAAAPARPPLVLVDLPSTKRAATVADEPLPLADPNKTYWSIEDVAAYWGVTAKTIREYRVRPGALPPADETFGRSPVWKPETIIGFRRPGRGARTDLKDGQ